MNRGPQVFEVLTLFPAAIARFVEAGLLGKAIEGGLVQVHCTNFRDFTSDRHRTVDDAPFGGGAGMVLKPEPIVAALDAITEARGPAHRILLTPSAPRFDQNVARRLSELPRIALLCGRYEGIDDRVREHFVDEALSIGDFVLGGGEVAALAIIEAVSRLHEGVLGNAASVVQESFAPDRGGMLLEYPQYTRPAEFRGYAVPSVLLGGDHAQIERWRIRAARRRTWRVRPDLRQEPAIPSSLQIHVAVGPGMTPDPGLATVLRNHRVSGLALLDASDEDAVHWVRVLEGKIPVASFSSVRSFRKRLRQRLGQDPAVVEARLADGTQPGAEGDPREVLDTLAQLEPWPRSALVLCFLSRAGQSEPLLSSADVDAILTLPPLAQEPDPPLATGATIADSSRPPLPLVDWVDQVLTGLLEQPDRAGRRPFIASDRVP